MLTKPHHIVKKILSKTTEHSTSSFQSSSSYQSTPYYYEPRYDGRVGGIHTTYVNYNYDTQNTTVSTIKLYHATALHLLTYTLISMNLQAAAEERSIARAMPDDSSYPKGQSCRKLCNMWSLR